MCILCVIQKWSRRVATMLPWLVIPLVGLWALSQLLPPAFQFEITSPRLACVFVLLITLFWYEILMPKLSAWRLRRNAMLRERKRYEAIELQKLRKTATKRCRNCLTPYKDQNPGGGKFMCSYCGHISKRPVLEIHVPPGLGFPSSGTIKDLVGKGGKLLNGKTSTDSRWTCSQDWLENGGWVGGSTTVKSSYWMRGGDGGMLVANDNCLAENSYLRSVIFGCKLLTSFFVRIRWLLRMIFRFSLSKDNASSGAEHRGAVAKRAENGLNFPESRVEKARRKAEEKRQARLERELSEEEERKQREEVARLVEERRRLRDEKIEAEKSRSKMSALINNRKREAETKRQERRRDKDNGSSKSNSDVEEIGKKAGKESERRKDFDRKSDVQRREPQKCTTEYGKGHSSEVGHGNGTKNTSVNHFSRGNAGNRYLDRMRGTFLSPSRAFSGNGFFGRNVNNPAAATKEVKLNSSADQPHTSFHRREMCPPSLAGKASISYNNKNANLSVPSEQHKAGPKKSWHQLFTRSSSALSSSSTNVIEQPNPKPQAELQNLQLPGTPSTIQSFDNPIHFGMPPPVSVPMYPDVSTRTGLCFSPPIESSVPNIPEESERFEDPCYVPDPISLLGPISESLDDFELDSGTCFASDVGLDRPCSLKKSAGLSEVSKPSPIESPLSRRIAEEKHNSNWFPIAPKGHESNPRSLDDAHKNEKGTWQMWNTSPLGQDGLGLAVAPGSWLLAPERIVLPNEDTLHPLSRQTMTSLFSTDDKFLSRSRSPQNECLGSGHNGVFNPAASSRDSELWLENAIFPPVSGNEGHIPVKSVEENIQDEIRFHSPNGAASNRSFEMPPQSGWSKKEWSTVQGSGEGVVKSSVNRASNGSLFPNPNPDVHSLW